MLRLFLFTEVLMKIALDINGGDHSPAEILKGAHDFIISHDDVNLILFTSEKISPDYKHLTDSPRVSTFFFPESILMTDTPHAAKKDKPVNTITGMLDYLAKGDADTAFSCGNSGALIMSAIETVGLKEKITTPALLSFIPVFNRRPLAVFDVGAMANHIFDADHYFQHIEEAVYIYRSLFGVKEPSVKILNIGSEEWKGTHGHRKLYQMLSESSYRFLGNIEGDKILNSDTDILITGGFCGNIVLKVLESFNFYAKEIYNNIDCKTHNNLLHFLSEEFSYETVGAALLLGLKGKVAVGHGKSNARAVKAGLETCLKYCKI